jgi:cysteine desulfurase
MVEDSNGVYLDHAAATPIDPRAPYEAIEDAREAVSELIAGVGGTVIFTAGDTEARNLAVTGVASANAHRGGHVVVSAVEHPATLAAARSFTRMSGELTVIGVDGEGHIDPDALAVAVTDTTTLVSIVHGQAEIGAVQDVAMLVAAARHGRTDVAVHVDAGATAGLLPIDVAAWDCDLLTLGGGSLFGPRWVGALWVREGIRLHPLIGGGLQEGGKRGGAHDVPGIVGLGVAARLARTELSDRAAHMTTLADQLRDRLMAIPDVSLNGPRRGRIPGHVQVSVAAVESETLVLSLGVAGLAASPGSACSAAGKSSPVLEAIGRDAPDTHSAVLFTLAPTTTTEEIDRAAEIVHEVVSRLRAMSPLA